MVKQIICTNGEIALCDDEDYPLLARFAWFMASSVDRGKPYPCCNVIGKQGVVKKIPMHQLVMAGLYGIDHKDNDSFNNQKFNLRESTYQQNGWNSQKQRTARGKPCTSKYKGVQYRPLRGAPRWLVYFKYVAPGAHKSTGKMIRVGYFWDEDDAARAYNAKAKELRGEWAWLNPVEPPFPIAA
jgi:hypothetical protein